MCLAIPAKVISIEKNLAKVDIAGVLRKVDVRLLEDLKIGDYILVHAGFGIEKINKREAKETLKILEGI
ncbi:MAG: HypC/HybG/HupF family hydrogenase formation chaperone [Candidatus Omnitrophica bacterium]|nr:HypC/HybG/HupF family hydrogenase formation chaperone [Candidatus Omnitrophota bacterium]